MNQFQTEGRRINQNAIEEIREEYRSLLNEYRRQYIHQITYIVDCHIRGISDSKMEDWIEDYLISEMRTLGNHQIRQIESHIDSSFYALSSQNTNIARKFQEYQEELQMLLRRNNSHLLEDINQNFIRLFTRKIEHYFDAFYGISNQNFYHNLEKIQEELKRSLSKKSAEFFEEYQNIIKITIKNSINKMNDKIEEISERNHDIPEEYINSAVKILGYSSYELVRENEKLYAKNNLNQLVIELKYNPEENIIISTDKSMAIQVRDDYRMLFDKNTDTAMVDYGLNFEISSANRKDIIKIVEGLGTISFYKNNQEITELKEIGTILQTLEAKAPGYYDKLCRDSDFRKMFAQVTLEQTQNNPEYEDLNNALVALDPSLDKSKSSQPDSLETIEPGRSR